MSLRPLTLALLLVAPPAARVRWVTIPGGRFLMGSDDPDEVSARHLASTFQLTRTEVTAAQYRRCVEPGSAPDRPRSRRRYPAARDPAVSPAGRRPPREYAARGGGLDRHYPWGNEDMDCRGRSCSTGKWLRSAGVLQARGNLHGLCDMAGVGNGSPSRDTRARRRRFGVRTPRGGAGPAPAWGAEKRLQKALEQPDGRGPAGDHLRLLRGALNYEGAPGHFPQR